MVEVCIHTSTILVVLLAYLFPYLFILRPIKMAENIVIKEVLNNPFSVRTLHDKLRKVNKG
jgi:hypothetical protein